MIVALGLDVDDTFLRFVSEARNAGGALRVVNLRAAVRGTYRFDVPARRSAILRLATETIDLRPDDAYYCLDTGILISSAPRGWPQAGKRVEVDRHLDAAGYPRATSDEPQTLQLHDHAMNRRRRDAEEALHVGFSGRTPVDDAVGMDEGEVLALFFGELRHVGDRHGSENLIWCASRRRPNR
jgi:hypothetical protein